MKIINFKPKAVFLLLILGCFASVSVAQNSVGINTTNPSPNAALHIVSPENNQGIIIPSLTTSQRTALLPSAAESGLLVYDTDESTFYYWKSTSWEKLGTGSIPSLVLPHNNIFVGDEEDTARAMPVSGAISITSTGKTTLSDNIVTPTKLYGISGNGTINEVLTSNGSGGFKWVTPVDNDKQTLSLSGNELTITDGNTIDISSINTDDQKATEVTYDNSTSLLAADNVQTAIDELNTNIENIVDTDDQTAGEVGYTNTSSGLAADNVQEAIDELNTNVKADADTDPNNEIQNLTLTGTILGLSKDATTIDLSSINTDDQKATEVTYDNSTSLLAADNVQTAIDELNTNIENIVDTDDQTAAEVAYTNTNSGLTADNVQEAIDELNTNIEADADTDPNNEIQDLSFDGTTLSLSKSSADINLSTINTDDQTAEEVAYNKTASSLAADNVQEAIDELNTNIEAIVDTDDQTAEEVSYTNPDLTATNVKEAIDEIKTSLGSGNPYAVPYWNDTDKKYKNSNLWSNGTGVIVSATAPTADADFVHTFSVDGSFKTNNIYHSSDERWKKNIVTLDNSLEKVQQLRGVSYEFKTDEFPNQNFNKGTQIGLIAQEIEKIYPELVTTDNNGFKAVEYANVVAILIEAIKEQQTLIESQNKEIESLKTSNAYMQTQIDTMQDFQNQINALQTQIAAMNSVLLILQPTANSSK